MNQLHSWIEDVELAMQNMNRIRTEAVVFMIKHLTDERWEVRVFST